MKMHIALAVKDLSASVAFYSKLFQMQPTKLKTDYAKFEPAEPNLILSMIVQTDPAPLPAPYHFGLRFDSEIDLKTRLQHLRDENIAWRNEGETTCCYADLNRAWTQDPDGHPWELYILQNDSQFRSDKTVCCPSQPSTPSAEAACCQ